MVLGVDEMVEVAGFPVVAEGSLGRAAAVLPIGCPNMLRAIGLAAEDAAGAGVAAGREGDGRVVSGLLEEPDKDLLCPILEGVAPPNVVDPDLSRSNGDGRSREPRCP